MLNTMKQPRQGAGTSGQMQADRLGLAMAREGVTAEELAGALGVDIVTLLARAYRRGDEFTLSDLRIMADRLQLAADEIEYCFFEV